MDSLNVISDINRHITELNEKLEKNSKATTVAFSYLYSRIEDLNKNASNTEDLSDRMTYFKTALSDTNSDLNKLSSYVSTFSINNDNYIVNTVSPLKDDIDTMKNSIKSLEERVSKIENTVKTINLINKQVNSINSKLEQILAVPDGYIIVRKNSKFRKFISKINDAFYRLFHQKEIREQLRLKAEEEERKRKAEEERKRKAEEERLRKEEEARILEEKKKEESRKKIKDLIKK